MHIINPTPNWPEIIKNKRFIVSLVVIVLYLLLIGCISGFLFSIIQSRNGFVITDPILIHLPSIDVSIAIFIVLYLLIVLSVLWILKDPVSLLRGLQAYALLTSLRFICMFLIPLEPPVGLIELRDPVVNLIFYGHTVITKDLFFSGHTSTLFLLFLIVKHEVLRYALLFGSMLIIVLLLIQHVHYTIDVLFALVFAFLSYKFASILSKRFSNSYI